MDPVPEIDVVPDNETQEQIQFNLVIGKLDWCLSKMVLYSKDQDLSPANKHTLKHHAEDMVAAANAIMKRLGVKQEGIPQPDYNPYKD